MIDLHLHSSASDGLETPSQLIELALNLKLKAIAITDHDTLAGLEELVSYGESKDIIVIPGIEISIRHEPLRELIDIHIIGLNIDYSSTRLKNAINEQIAGRLEQKKAICKRLEDEFDYEISFKEVKAVAGGKVVGRPHIVEIMKKNNPEKVKGKSKNELFKMISIGGVAYVDREVELSFEESIELIKNAGGIPILAHPERNINIQDNYQLILEWIRQDCLVQINAGSIAGSFGKRCQKVTEYLLAARAIHFVGSDAHDPVHRNYQILIKAYQYISERFGEEYAQILFYKNPQKIWQGEQVIAYDLLEEGSLVPTMRVTAHEIRAVSVTLAALKHVLIKQILNKGYWKSRTTFMKFCFKDLL